MINTKLALLASYLLAIAFGLIVLACGATPESTLPPTERSAEPHLTASGTEPAQKQPNTVKTTTVKATPRKLSRQNPSLHRPRPRR